MEDTNSYEHDIVEIMKKLCKKNMSNKKILFISLIIIDKNTRISVSNTITTFYSNEILLEHYSPKHKN